MTAAVAPATAGTGTRAAARTAAPLLLAVAAAAALPVLPGKLVLLDVVCVAALPLLAATLVKDRRLGVLVLVSAAWAVGQICSDLANGLPPRPSQGVVTAVGVVLITAMLLRLAAGDQVRLTLLVAAVIAGWSVGAALQSDVPAWPVPEIWKYALGAPVSVAVLALCDLLWRAGSRRPVFVALAALTAVDLVLDFRSLALLSLLTLMLFATAPRRPAWRGGLATVLRLAVLAGVLLGGFLAAAQAGLLGERTTAQVRQNGADLTTIAVNLRPESLQSVHLIAQRPVTGYGSQPRLDSTAFADSLRFVAAHGVRVDVNLRRDWQRSAGPGIAQHSMVFGTAVMAGVLALPFWLYLWRTGIRAALTAVRLRASPLVVFWTLLILWDSVFSPLTGLLHVGLAAYLALVLSGGTDTGSRRSADALPTVRRASVASTSPDRVPQDGS